MGASTIRTRSRRSRATSSSRSGTDAGRRPAGKVRCLRPRSVGQSRLPPRLARPCACEAASAGATRAPTRSEQSTLGIPGDRAAVVYVLMRSCRWHRGFLSGPQSNWRSSRRRHRLHRSFVIVCRRLRSRRRARWERWLRRIGGLRITAVVAAVFSARAEECAGGTAAATTVSSFPRKMRLELADGARGVAGSHSGLGK